MMKRRSTPLNALRAFEATGRLGRITAAARELSVTHGAVSRQVRHLETILGVDLFEGARSRPVITPAGGRLLAALTPAFDQIDAALRAIEAEGDGLLEVACLSTFAVRWLIPHLHKFQRLHPGIEVRLSTDDRRTEGARGRHDVVITVLDAEAKIMAGDVVLFGERLGVVVAPQWAPSDAPLVFEDLANLPQLATLTRMNAWPQWLTATGANPVLESPKPAATFEHYSFTIQAISHGLGAGILPFHLVAEDLHSGRLVAPFGFVESGYRYIARPRQPLDEKAARFLRWIGRQAAEDAGRL